jgi:hypothetical protein
VPKAVFSYLLPEKTIVKGEKAAGHVVFKKTVDEGYFVFSMSASGTDFVFPVGHAFGKPLAEKK